MDNNWGRLDGDTVVEVWDFEPNLADGLVVVELPKNVQPNWLREADGYAPPVLPAVAAPVPASVSKAQAKIALQRAGHLSAALSAVEGSSDPEVAIWFADASIWERQNQYVVQIGEALGLTASDIDALFVAAAAINA